MSDFRTELASNIFYQKYSLTQAETWRQKAITIVDNVCGTVGGTEQPLMSATERKELEDMITTFQFMPGGRYIYYAGRLAKFYNNCYLFKSMEDSREDWANLANKATESLMTGGGIGNDYSVYREEGRLLAKTGGKSSGPIPLMKMINEVGRNVMQGGSRRSAIYASLNWQHGDIFKFLIAKDWDNQPSGLEGISIGDLKKADFNFNAPLDMTNISVNYDDAFLSEVANSPNIPPVFLKNVEMAMQNGEPGFSFNFGDKQDETARNACVPYDTPILTSGGYVPIGEVVGKSVSIWNGASWEKVEPFNTGTRDLVKVTLSDGSSLTCSTNHEFIGEDKEVRVQAENLPVGFKLGKFEMPVVSEGINFNMDAYSQGFYSGDGNTDLPYSWLYSTKYCCGSRLQGSLGKEHESSSRKTWKHGAMLSKSFVPIGGSSRYCLEWLAGVLDADGTVTRDKNGNGLQLSSINLPFLEETKLMLTRLSVRAKICKGSSEGYRTLPDGRGGQKNYFCQEVYRLLIGNLDTYQLVKLGISFSRLQVHPYPPQRDARQFVRVLSVEDAGMDETYCFTEPKANRGTFNGIVTGQCCEVTSADDSDVCNLGSVNMAACDDIHRFKRVVELGSKFLVCGTIRAELPNDKIRATREKNRRLGLGLMGVHEWLLQRGEKYEVTPEMHGWLQIYKDSSEEAANSHCDRFFLSRPAAYRAIAPTGTIGILAGTTTGIEPLYAVAYKRRYLVDGTKWRYEYVVDHMAQTLVAGGYDPESIETAVDLAMDPERRIKFQADVQDYVDMAISSTLNLPSWGSKYNNEKKVIDFASTIIKYAPRLRGLTMYPDGARGGQPITKISYEEAIKHKGVIFEENDVCAGGVCGL